MCRCSGKRVGCRLCFTLRCIQAIFSLSAFVWLDGGPGFAALPDHCCLFWPEVCRKTSIRQQTGRSVPCYSHPVPPVWFVPFKRASWQTEASRLQEQLFPTPMPGNLEIPIGMVIYGVVPRAKVGAPSAGRGKRRCVAGGREQTLAVGGRRCRLFQAFCIAPQHGSGRTMAPPAHGRL